MKRLVLANVGTLLAFGAFAQQALLLDATQLNEFPITSNVAYQEVLAEQFTFTTTEPNQQVTISASWAYSVHQSIDGDENGAFRLYLDGDAFIYFPSGAKQWNGLIIGNGGAWCARANVPNSSHSSVTHKFTIATPGTHTLRMMYAGTKTWTVGTLRTVRRYQVW